MTIADVEYWYPRILLLWTQGHVHAVRKPYVGLRGAGPWSTTDWYISLWQSEDRFIECHTSNEAATVVAGAEIRAGRIMRLRDVEQIEVEE